MAGQAGIMIKLQPRNAQNIVVRIFVAEAIRLLNWINLKMFSGGVGRPRMYEPSLMKKRAL